MTFDTKGTNPKEFDLWWDDEHGTQLDDEYNVYDEVDEEDRPDYEM